MEITKHRYRPLGQPDPTARGRVEVAEDLGQPGQKVFIKRVAAGAGPDPMTSLEREFEILSTLHHPNLVRVFDLIVDREAARACLVLEYVVGEELGRWMGRLLPRDSRLR